MLLQLLCAQYKIISLMITRANLSTWIFARKQLISHFLFNVRMRLIRYRLIQHMTRNPLKILLHEFFNLKLAFCIIRHFWAGLMRCRHWGRVDLASIFYVLLKFLYSCHSKLFMSFEIIISFQSWFQTCYSRKYLYGKLLLKSANIENHATDGNLFF